MSQSCAFFSFEGNILYKITDGWGNLGAGANSRSGTVDVRVWCDFGSNIMETITVPLGVTVPGEILELRLPDLQSDEALVTVKVNSISTTH